MPRKWGMQTFRGKRQLSLKQRRKIRAKFGDWLKTAKEKHAPHGVPGFKTKRAMAAKINVVRNAQTLGSGKFGWRDKKMRTNAAPGMKVIIPDYSESHSSMNLEKALRVLKRATKGQKKGSPRTSRQRTF